jgi:hypothetical protein
MGGDSKRLKMGQGKLWDLCGFRGTHGALSSPIMNCNRIGKGLTVGN